MASSSAPFEPLPSSYSSGKQPEISFNSSAFTNVEIPAQRVNKYETKLPIRLDYEAALTYCLFCFSGVFFLIFETKNDYVRFHAWQSSLLYLGCLVIQFLFSLFVPKMVWAMLAFEIVSALYLGYQAYVNSDSLFRFQVPILGRIASTWVDAE